MPHEKKEQNEPKKQEFEFPKKIHFIWLGGPIPKEYLASIYQIAVLAKRSGFEINLWVDNSHNYLATASKEDIFIPNLQVKNISEIYEKMQVDPFYQKDNRFNQFKSYIEREQVGWKNLGSASDLLRYEILRQEGGYYFDTDTEFAFDKDSLLKPDKSLLGIRGAGRISCSRTFPRGKEPRFTFDGASWQNDIIAALPNHDALKKIILLAMKNYQLLDEDNLVKKSANQVDFFQVKKMDLKRKPSDFNPLNRAEENRFNLTIMNSGPRILGDVLESQLLAYKEKYDSSAGGFSYQVLCDMQFQTKNYSVDYQVAGITAISRSDQTWVMKPEGEQKKAKQLPSFDDLSLLKKRRY